MKRGPHPRPKVERFWEKVEFMEGGCWYWTGAVAGHGYGQLRDTGGRKGIYAHRFSYELHRGPIPTGMDIDHLCRTRHCVNPRHLEVVTHQENVRRGPSSNMQTFRTGKCKRGHVFAETGVYSYNGKRQCRMCVREWAKRKR